MNATLKNIKIPARDGYQLSATLFKPQSESKGFVQIHSGTGIPQKLYANFANHLAENGYTALTFDYRGIAASGPKNLKNFEAKISDWGKLDMAGVLDWATTNFPDQKKMVIAHSMGGQMIGLMDNHAVIDKLFLIASSTGYWKDMSSPYKWLPAFFWYFFIPLHTNLFGYVNAEKIKQGENLPKGIALQWRKWCTHPNYFELDFENDLSPNFFDKIDTPITAIQIQDDPLANKVTSNKLLQYYSNAPIEVQEVIPNEYGVDKIGHTGYFSRKFKNSLWEKMVTELN